MAAEFVEPDLSPAGVARGALEQAREALGNALCESPPDESACAEILDLVTAVSKRARSLAERSCEEGGAKTQRRRRPV